MHVLLRRFTPIQHRCCNTHHEYVTCVWTFATVAEEFEKIVELPMDVTAYSYGALYRMHGAFLEHELHHILAQMLQIFLWQELALAN